jgi:hypothetical protein
VGGVEANHSCIKVLDVAMNWSSAVTACSAVYPGAHLLSTQQVWAGQWAHGQVWDAVLSRNKFRADRAP